MTDDFEFGVMLSATSNSYGIPDDELPAVFRRSAQVAEDSGFDVVVAGDHIAYPDQIPNDYEFSKTGDPPFDTETSVYDIFQVFAHLAAVTDDVDLGTNVLAAPLRHPVVTVKNVFTLDSLSDGRFDFGLAPGWLSSEFEALGIPFEERGARTDEFMEIYELALEEGITGFDGDFYELDPVGFYPQPAHDIPVWIGGKSGATFRRVAEYGDGWSTLWDHPDQVAAARDRILNAWEDYDRDGEPRIGVMRPVSIGDDADPDRLLSGTGADILEDVEAYREAGTTRLIVDFFTTDIEEQVALMEQFGNEVIDAF